MNRFGIQNAGREDRHVKGFRGKAHSLIVLVKEALPEFFVTKPPPAPQSFVKE